MSNKKKDSDRYFDKLATLRNEYHSNTETFDEEKIIAVTLANVPNKYEGVLTGVIREKGSTLELNDHMQEALHKYWRICNDLMMVTMKMMLLTQMRKEHNLCKM